MTSPRIDTPSPPPGSLVSGSFRRGPGFATYRERGSQDWLLIYNLSGRGHYYHAQGYFETKAGDMILLKPHTRHDYRTDPDSSHWEPLWAHFMPRPEWISWLDWPVIAPGLLHLSLSGSEQHGLIVRRFRKMLQLNASPHRSHEALAMNALEEILLWSDLANPKHETAHLDSRIRLALDHISAHFSEPLSIGQIASACGLSASRFAHLFREQIGETPQRYLELKRLHRARQLLEFTQEPVRLIAAQVGFESPFYFTLRFKRHSGVSPREWRQRAAVGHTAP